MTEQTPDTPKFIVVVGTSAGGIRALEELVMQLEPEWDAAYFLVLHLSRKGVGRYLFQWLQEATKLQCKIATHGEAIQRGIIYIAPPDEHMLVTNNQVIIGRGAPENRLRPSSTTCFGQRRLPSIPV